MKSLYLLLVCLSGFLNARAQAGSPDLSFAGKGWIKADFNKGNNFQEIGQQILAQKNGTYILVFQLNGYTVLSRFLPNGRRDSSYGIQGFSIPLKLQPVGAALQSDGKVAVAGRKNSPSDFALARFNTDGSPDTSFGVHGMTTTDFSGGNDLANAMAIQDNGKIVLAGTTSTNRPQLIALARYNANGSLDTSFDHDGMLTTDFHAADQAVNAVAIQNDGKIVAAGYSTDYQGSPFSYDFALIRYNIDGSLDSSFDHDGMLTTDIGQADMANALAIRADGKIVAAGSYMIIHGRRGFIAIAWYNMDGSLYRKGISDFQHDFQKPTSVAVAKDGKLLVSGIAYDFINNDQPDFVVARYKADGGADSSFNAVGYVFADFNGGYDYPTSMALDSNGKIVLAGYSSPPDGINYYDYALARFNTDGTPDNSFDEDGKLTGFYPASISNYQSIAVQADGKILAAGSTYDQQMLRNDFAIARYLPDGSADTSFHRDGKLTTDFNNTADNIVSIAIQPDGKIIAAGITENPVPGYYNQDIALARYNPDGSPDSSFGRDGKLTTNIVPIDKPRSVAIQRDGKIVVAGGENIIVLVRYLPDGILDSSFDGDGKMLDDRGLYSAFALVVQDDGKLLVSGTAQNKTTNNLDFLLVRYNADGSADTSFGNSGRVMTDFNGGFDYGNSVALQNDGKIVVAGETEVAGSNNEANMALARYLANGSPDASFGTNGKQTLRLPGNKAVANALSLQTDGKLLVAGFTQNAENQTTDFALVRLLADGSPDSSFDGDGIQTADYLLGNDMAYSSAIYKDRLYVAGHSSNYEEVGIVAAWQLGCRQQSFFRDQDHDGYGDVFQKMIACQAPDGYVSDSTDCNDGDAAIHPGAQEICGNRIDDNCDGQVDEGCPAIAFLTINNVMVYENQGTATLTVRLSKKVKQAVRVNYSTLDRTATSKPNKKTSPDYVAASGTLTIEPGTQTASISIKIIYDDIMEPDEFFDVHLFHPVNAAMGDVMGQVTIKDVPVAAAGQSKLSTSEQNNVQGLSARVQPNPSSGLFNLVVGSSNNNPVSIRLNDVMGRLIESREGVVPGAAVQIGYNLKPGIYYAEVMQGNERVELKLVKQ